MDMAYRRSPQRRVSRLFSLSPKPPPAKVSRPPRTVILASGFDTNMDDHDLQLFTHFNFDPDNCIDAFSRIPLDQPIFHDPYVLRDEELSPFSSSSSYSKAKQCADAWWLDRSPSPQSVCTSDQIADVYDSYSDDTFSICDLIDDSDGVKTPEEEIMVFSAELAHVARPKVVHVISPPSSPFVPSTPQSHVQSFSQALSASLANASTAVEGPYPATSPSISRSSTSVSTDSFVSASSYTQSQKSSFSSPSTAKSSISAPFDNGSPVTKSFRIHNVSIHPALDTFTFPPPVHPASEAPPSPQTAFHAWASRRADLKERSPVFVHTSVVEVPPSPTDSARSSVVSTPTRPLRYMRSMNFARLLGRGDVAV